MKPSKQYIEKEEKMWRVTLPQDYKEFLLEHNGGIPIKREFEYNKRMYMIMEFLCVLENTDNIADGYKDIDVVLSQIEDRLTDNEDLIGCEILPIAELFAGDYLCLDFRINKIKPSVCIWNHEESGELNPVTYYVADSFTEFLSKIK